MSDTSTPRTDAVYGKGLRGKYIGDSLCEQLETDLQHLARVAGEALDSALKKGSKWHPCDPTVVQMKAALSEIQRIKNRPI